MVGDKAGIVKFWAASEAALVRKPTDNGVSNSRYYTHHIIWTTNLEKLHLGQLSG